MAVQTWREIGIKAVIVLLGAWLLAAPVDPATAGGAFPVVTKYEALDLLPDLQSFNGWVLDKVEGLAVAADGKGYALTDNDGVDGSSGETRLLRLGRSLH